MPDCLPDCLPVCLPDCLSGTRSALKPPPSGSLIAFLNRYSETLSACTDLHCAAWQKAKRRLTLAQQREQAPLPLGHHELALEFVRVPRVKLLLRNVLLVVYSCLFVLVLLTRVETHAAVSAAAAAAPSSSSSTQRKSALSSSGAAISSSAAIASAAAAVPWGWLPIWVLEPLFLWWTFNLVVDHASQHARRPRRALSLNGPGTILEVSTLLLILFALGLAWHADQRRRLEAEAAAHGDRSPPPPPSPSPPPPSPSRPAGGWAGVPWGRHLSSVDVADGTQDETVWGAAEVSLLILGMCAIPMAIRLLNLLTQHRILGVLMIILSKMISDVALFLVIFSVSSEDGH